MANNNKRAERMAKSDRNVNRAMILLTVGLVAEFYLLMVNNYFVKGAVGQVLVMMSVLKVRRDRRRRSFRRGACAVDHAQKVDALRACRAVASVRGILLRNVL